MLNYYLCHRCRLCQFAAILSTKPTAPTSTPTRLSRWFVPNNGCCKGCCLVSFSYKKQAAMRERRTTTDGRHGRTETDDDGRTGRTDRERRRRTDGTDGQKTTTTSVYIYIYIYTYINMPHLIFYISRN